jgi:hypothetical protein
MTNGTAKGSGRAFVRQLGGGLFEFRLRESNLLLRAFCHAYGNKVVLLLAAYDKSDDPSAKHQHEIELACHRRMDGQQRLRRSWQYGF